jgi:hypothetical protein
MKKGLLLSIVASTMIFAGGDIAPVEPAAAAPAADCSDFSGVAGLHYRTSDKNAHDLFSKENSSLYGTAAISYEGMIAYGIGFGTKLGGKVDLTSFINSDVGRTDDTAEISRVYLTASFGNTAIKVGRYDLPGALSPLLYTDSSDGIDATTYEGILFANTDLADTTVYGTALFGTSTDNTTRSSFLAGDKSGAYALGFVNKSVANTTITAVGYYVTDINAAEAVDAAVYGGALTVAADLDGYKVTGQVAYLTDDDDATTDNESLQASLMVGTKFGMVGITARAWYTNDGVLALGDNDLNGQGFGAGREQTGVRFDASAPVSIGTLYGRLDYVSYDKVVDTSDTKLHARLGYRFNVLDGKVELKAEYRYTDLDKSTAGYEADNAVRLDATYRF